jgi:hypothetical protein
MDPATDQRLTGIRLPPPEREWRRLARRERAEDWWYAVSFARNWLTHMAQGVVQDIDAGHRWADDGGPCG